MPSRRKNVGREMGMANGKAFSQIFTGKIGISGVAINPEEVYTSYIIKNITYIL
jgi:hypothetical protein